MTRIMIKRVYEPAEKQDGYRILVDKLWPRGVKKETLRYDLWPKDVAPSTQLRQWYHEDMDSRWPEFRRRYMKELSSSAETEDLIKKIRTQDTVTLLYASRNETQNHALVLREFLEGKL